MEAPAVTKCPAAGPPAPDFAPGASGRPPRLKALLGKPLVLALYPLDGSRGCSQQLHA
jgi:peroxiredoxin